MEHVEQATAAPGEVRDGCAHRRLRSDGAPGAYYCTLCHRKFRVVS